MEKADARVCVGYARFYSFPDWLEDARQSCTPKGRCKVGWIVSRGRPPELERVAGGEHGTGHASWASECLSQSHSLPPENSGFPRMHRRSNRFAMVLNSSLWYTP